jgi:hypothetical protein
MLHIVVRTQSGWQLHVLNSFNSHTRLNYINIITIAACAEEEPKAQRGELTSQRSPSDLQRWDSSLGHFPFFGYVSSLYTADLYWSFQYPWSEYGGMGAAIVSVIPSDFQTHIL